MKLIIVYIQPDKLIDVKQALEKKEVFKMSVIHAMGCGWQKGSHESYQGVTMEGSFLKKVRLEIAVNDNFVKPAVEAIIAGAQTGNIGDGKIFILDLPECIRIRTGETGGIAIG
jgi:nitrogen regulatory protein P-II 2